MSKLPADVGGDRIGRCLFPNRYPDMKGYPEPPEEYMRKIINFDKMGLPSEHD